MSTELCVGLGLDIQTQAYLNEVFKPFEDMLNCADFSLSGVSRELLPVANKVGADRPADAYNPQHGNWYVTNAGLRRLMAAGERFDEIVQRNTELRKNPITKEVMSTFITTANHLAHTNGKIAAGIDDKVTRKGLTEEGAKAIETAVFWAKDYGLIIERNKSLNDFVKFRRDNCLTLPPLEAIRELALLTMTLSMVIDTSKQLGLPPNANHLNNLGVLYTDMAELFSANPNIKVRGINFETSLDSALKAFRDADTQVETIEDKDSAEYKKKKIMVASNRAQIYLLSAENVIASSGPEYPAHLVGQLKGFNQHFDTAAGIIHDLSEKTPKEETDQRILEFFRSEIYCRGIRALIVTAQYVKQGFTRTPEFHLEKKRVLNIVSRFDGKPLERLDFSWQETYAYAQILMTKFYPEDEDDKVAKQKVAQLMERVATS